MRTLLVVAVILVSSCRSGPKPEAVTTHDAGAQAKQVVVQTGSGGRYPVRVEIAADAPSQQQGLMYRRDLGAEDGMLFIFDDDRVQTFWMRNTLIPLDMIFIKADGTIAGIVPEATPLTETPRSVGVPSRYVLEVNGGWAARKGVKAGDRVMLSGALP